jgi:hypothetical protein
MLIKTLQVLATLSFFTCTGSLAYFVGHNAFTIPIEMKLKDHSQTVTQGGQIMVTWNVKEHWTGCRIDAERYLTMHDKSYSIPLPTIKKNDNPNERETYLQLPKQLPPGYYQYHVKLKFTCNIAHRLFGPTIVKSPSFFVRIVDSVQDNVYTKLQNSLNKN